MRASVRSSPPASHQECDVSPVHTFVCVCFIDEHEFRPSVWPHSDTEQRRESCRRQPLVEHLGGCEEDVRGFGEHPLPCEADLVWLHALAAVRICAQQPFKVALDVALQPCHVLAATWTT